MSFPKAIKIVLPGDIRKLHNQPKTLEELKNTISALFPDLNFEISYNTCKKINSTKDLLEAYDWSLNCPSLKLYLTKPCESSEKCLVCFNIIQGPVYQCLECKLVHCSPCESRVFHSHIMLKGKSLTEIKKSPYYSFIPENFELQISKFEKKMIKLKVLSHIIPKDLVVQPGQEVLIGWKIQNIGMIDWPESSVLM